MNFFAHQEQARRQTRRMLVLFALAVLAIVAATDLAVLLALDIQDAGRVLATMDWRVLGTMSALVAAVILLGSLYRVATLTGGGAAVARELGGTPVEAETRNFAYLRLRNVVEEIAIASGVPVPDVFVLEDEAGINAFASGFTPADAAITVTRGALDKLTRDELQGVIGHEFSHILNGDMRLNIRLMGIVFGILVLATVGRKIAEVSGRGRRSSGGAVIFGLAVFAVGYIGVVFARLIKASISRQREFLADASAVQFTRQTSGIAGALKKIGSLAEGSRLQASETEEVAHMLFGDGVGYSALFATHPPLEERIVRLDPSFDRDELARIAAAWSEPVHVADDLADAADVSISGLAPANIGVRHERLRRDALPPPSATLSLSPADVAAQVGHPEPDDRAAAHAIATSIPDRLREAASRRDETMPLVFALLLGGDADVRRRQLETIRQRHDEGMFARVQAFGEITATLHPSLRLPLASLSFPLLRRRPRPEIEAFVATLDALIAADGRVSIHEYCLAKLVALQVVDALAPAGARSFGRVRLPEVRRELADLVATVARHGHDDEASARQAYLDGIDEVLPGVASTYAPPGDWVAALDRALPRLDRLAPAGKELVVRALTRAIARDGLVSVEEAELLRVVCAALHCPLPPLIDA